MLPGCHSSVHDRCILDLQAKNNALALQSRQTMLRIQQALLQNRVHAGKLSPRYWIQAKRWGDLTKRDSPCHNMQLTRSQVWCHRLRAVNTSFQAFLNVCISSL